MDPFYKREIKTRADAINDYTERTLGGYSGPLFIYKIDDNIECKHSSRVGWRLYFFVLNLKKNCKNRAQIVGCGIY